MEEALFALVVPAVIRLMELVNHKEWQSAAKILVAGLIGLTAGYFGIYGLTPIDGLGYGLSASGLMTVAGYAGRKARPLPAPAQ